MKQSMTVQELCDKLTVLCHEGHAQAQVRHVTGYEVKAITDVEMVGNEVALITSREFCKSKKKEQGNCNEKERITSL